MKDILFFKVQKMDFVTVSFETPCGIVKVNLCERDLQKFDFFKNLKKYQKIEDVIIKVPLEMSEEEILKTFSDEIEKPAWQICMEKENESLSQAPRYCKQDEIFSREMRRGRRGMNQFLAKILDTATDTDQYINLHLAFSSEDEKENYKKILENIKRGEYDLIPKKVFQEVESANHILDHSIFANNIFNLIRMVGHILFWEGEYDKNPYVIKTRAIQLMEQNKSFFLPKYEIHPGAFILYNFLKGEYPNNAYVDCGNYSIVDLIEMEKSFEVGPHMPYILESYKSYMRNSN